MKYWLDTLTDVPLPDHPLTVNRFLNLRDTFIAEGRPIYSFDETGFGMFSYKKITAEWGGVLPEKSFE